MVFSLPFIATYCAILTYAYHILGFKLFRSYLDDNLPKAKFYDNLAYEGKNGADAAEEFKYYLILTAHHLVGGFLMLIAYLFNSPTLFAHGICLEIADDVHDTIVLLGRKWPFKGPGNMNLVKVMLPHHLFGMIAGPIALSSSLHANIHTIGLGASLLSAGGISMAVLCFRRTLNRDDFSTKPIEAWKEMGLRTINFATIVICRWIFFPYQIFMLGFVDGYFSSFPLGLKALILVATLGMIAFNTMATIVLSSGLVECYELANKKMHFTEAKEIFFQHLTEATQSLTLPSLSSTTLATSSKSFLKILEQDLIIPFLHEVQNDLRQLTMIN